MRSVNDGNYLRAILEGVNTYNNAKKIKGKKAVKEELKGIVKEGVLDLGKQAGTITNPVGNFSVGSAIAVGVAAATIATIKGDPKQNNTVIDNPTHDTVTYLTSDESYNLITVNETIKDKVSSGIYYKDIGSRKNLTIAESDIEYAGSSDSTKTVYRTKAITDIRKLVTEGFIKISRESQDVTIVTEKANL